MDYKKLTLPFKRRENKSISIKVVINNRKKEIIEN